MYSAVIRSGKVEVKKSAGKGAEKTANHIGASDSGVHAIAVETGEDEVTITWSDGTASVHSLPDGEEIRKA